MAPRAAALEIKLSFAGLPRRLALGRWSALLVVAVMPLAALWLSCAALYLVFHDDLLASLIKRQTDMQYAYEDRIATLQADLDTTTGAAAGDS